MSSKVKNNRIKEQIFDIVMNNKAFVILIILVVVMSFASPVFLTKNNLLNVLRQVCYSAILCTGLTLVLASGHVDLSIGCMVGFIGVIIAKCIMAGLPIPAAILSGVLCGMAFGAVTATIITIFRLPPFIVTLATMSIFKGATYLVTGMVPISGLPNSFIFLGQGYVGGIPVQIFIMLVAVAVMYIIVNYTKFGRHAIAVGGNSEASRVSGVNVSMIRLKVYMLLGVYVAIAATVLTARSASAQVAAGQNTEMDAIAAAVIGGTPLSGGQINVLGSLFGCMMVGVINNSLNLLGFDTNWQIIAKGLLILFALMIDVTSTRIYDKRNKGKQLA